MSSIVRTTKKLFSRFSHISNNPSLLVSNPNVLLTDLNSFYLQKYKLEDNKYNFINLGFLDETIPNNEIIYLENFLNRRNQEAINTLFNPHYDILKQFKEFVKNNSFRNSTVSHYDDLTAQAFDIRKFIEKYNYFNLERLYFYLKIKETILIEVNGIRITTSIYYLINIFSPNFNAIMNRNKNFKEIISYDGITEERDLLSKIIIIEKFNLYDLNILYYRLTNKLTTIIDKIRQENTRQHKLDFKYIEYINYIHNQNYISNITILNLQLVIEYVAKILNITYFYSNSTIINDSPNQDNLPMKYKLDKYTEEIIRIYLSLVGYPLQQSRSIIRSNRVIDSNDVLERIIGGRGKNKRKLRKYK